MFLHVRRISNITYKVSNFAICFLWKTIKFKLSSKHYPTKADHPLPTEPFHDTHILKAKANQLILLPSN